MEKAYFNLEECGRSMGKYQKDTIIAQLGVIRDEKYGAISTPIYHSATYRHPGVGQSTGFDYARTANPTRQQAELAIAKLEDSQFAFAFASGMAALSTVMGLFKAGDHILLSEDLYGGTYRLLKQHLYSYGIEADFVDTTSYAKIEQAWKNNTCALLIETPSNPLMKITDIRRCSQWCKSKSALLIVDNTFMTAYYQRPLELGADITVYSGTKYLAGHNDLLAGAIVVQDATLAEKIGFIQNTVGNVLSPGDSWMLLRSLKTLGLRMERQTANAKKIVEWAVTEGSRWIEDVYYPGLDKHPGHVIHRNQAADDGAMVALRLKREDVAIKLLPELQIFSFAESLGGVESLITIPSFQTHGDMPEEYRQSLGITNSLLRVSVGIEDAQDLIEDLQSAIEKVSK